MHLAGMAAFIGVSAGGGPKIGQGLGVATVDGRQIVFSGLPHGGFIALPGRRLRMTGAGRD